MATDYPGVTETYTRDTEITFSTKKDCDENGIDIVLEFPSDGFKDVPIISRQLVNERSGNIGYGILRCDVVLTGIAEGFRHSNVVDRLMELEFLVGRNDLYMTYVTKKDDPNPVKIIDNVRVYIDRVSEPQGWKQFDANFSIQLHYYINVCDLNGSFGITAHYEQYDLDDFAIPDPYPDTPTPISITPLSTYEFDPVPHYAASVNSVNGSPTASPKSPYGLITNQAKRFSLTGVLKADEHVGSNNPRDDLSWKMDQLSKAFQRPGILHYGAWSKPVYVISGPKFSSTLPHSHVKYSIDFVTYEDQIQHLRCERDFSIPHRFTKVTNRLYCFKNEVRQFHKSGQYVSYSMTLRSNNRQKTRELLKRELESFVAGGGYLMPGGSERWLNDRTIAYRFQMYYLEPLLEFLLDTDVTNPENIPSAVNLH